VVGLRQGPESHLLAGSSFRFRSFDDNWCSISSVRIGRIGFEKMPVCVCLALAASTMAAAQNIGSRNPDVSDWRSFHRQIDRDWARQVTATRVWRGMPGDHSKAEVTAKEVRAIRLAAGIPDDYQGDPILQFAWMKEYQFLLVRATTDACMNVAVYEEGFKRLKRIWSIATMPDGQEICRSSGCPSPRANVNEKQKVTVGTAFRSTPDQPVCDRVSSATYRPKGHSFEVENQHNNDAMCWGNSFYRGLGFAFQKAAGPGVTLAIVQVLGVLKGDRYALVLQRGEAGVVALRMELNPEDWTATLFSNGTTASECFARAQSVPVNVTSLADAENWAEAMANALQSIDLESDHCARGADGQCVHFLDGREFYVQIGDRSPIGLTDVPRRRGYSSENPALSAWVYRLLEQAKAAAPIATTNN